MMPMGRDPPTRRAREEHEDRGPVRDAAADVIRRWAGMAASGNAQGLVGLYAANAMLLAPDGEHGQIIRQRFTV